MLVLHILSFGFVLGVTAIADKDAIAWIRGKKRVLERSTMMSYHVLIWVGLIALTISGLYLFFPMRLFLLRELLFDVKILFVAILFINAILIVRLMQVALVKPFVEVSTQDKVALFASGAISIFSWFCAAAIAINIF